MGSISNNIVTILQFLLPGFIAAWIFYSLTSYSKPSQFERVVQALIFTLFIQALVITVKYLFLKVGEYWSAGSWSESSSLIISIIIAIVFKIRGRYPYPFKIRGRYPFIENKGTLPFYYIISGENKGTLPFYYIISKNPTGFLHHPYGVSHDKLITDYDIGVLQNEYQDYLQSMIRQKHIEILQRNTHKGLP
ncbi:MAG: hypothetical protein HFP77_00315, partial [Methylococcales symbiont of Iophon sp. n. MRB-2018]